jgi:hypothetical protein
MARRETRRPSQHRAARFGSPALRRRSNWRQRRRSAGRLEQGGDVEEEISSSAKVRVATRRAASSSLAPGIGGRLEAETLGFVASQRREENWERKRRRCKVVVHQRRLS